MEGRWPAASPCCSRPTGLRRSARSERSTHGDGMLREHVGGVETSPSALKARVHVSSSLHIVVPSSPLVFRAMANQLGYPAVRLGSDVVPSEGTLVVTATWAAASLALLYGALVEASVPRRPLPWAARLSRRGQSHWHASPSRAGAVLDLPDGTSGHGHPLVRGHVRSRDHESVAASCRGGQLTDRGDEHPASPLACRYRDHCMGCRISARFLDAVETTRRPGRRSTGPQMRQADTQSRRSVGPVCNRHQRPGRTGGGDGSIRLPWERGICGQRRTWIRRLAERTGLVRSLGCRRRSPSGFWGRPARGQAEPDRPIHGSDCHGRCGWRQG